VAQLRKIAIDYPLDVAVELQPEGAVGDVAQAREAGREDLIDVVVEAN
jgi:hypothetical protein